MPSKKKLKVKVKRFKEDGSIERNYKPDFIDLWDEADKDTRRLLEKMAKKTPGLKKIFEPIKETKPIKKALLKRKIFEVADKIKAKNPNITNTDLAYHEDIAPLFEEVYSGMTLDHRLEILSKKYPGKPGRPAKK